ncbi:MAG: arginine--tRNA ligase, partial [bacterium]
MHGVDYIKKQISKAIQDTGMPFTDEMEIQLERPNLSDHGDLATNIAMKLASQLRRNPKEIASELLEKLELDSEVVAKVEVAGAGFINFHFSEQYYRNSLKEILQAGENYGCSQWGNKQKLQIEFVSANPTGPLNVVSARAATVGDVLAKLFQAVGFESQKEYYVNDAGRQVRLLGMSVSARYMALLGHDEPFPKEGYHGDYIRDLAQEFLDEYGEKFVTLDKETRWGQFSHLALEKIVASQQKVLEKFRIYFDNWFRESQLRNAEAHIEILQRFSQKDLLYEKDGAKWFKASQFGDEKDRVLVT